MRHPKCTVIALVVAVSLISGCQSKPYSNTQRYEVMAPAQAVNSEEAVNFIRAQTELDQSRKGGAEYNEGPNNHPAFVGGGGQSYTALTIRENESLLSVANRVMGMASFTRLIYDLTDEAPSPDSVQARKRVSTLGGPTLFGEIASVYQEQFPGVQLYAALDGEGHALVISDKRYARWSTLAIYDVKPGTLSENARALSSYLGWDLPEKNGWTTGDFPIAHGYPIVIEPANARSALIALLDRYPAQAQLNPNTKLVTVVGRPAP